MDSFVLQLRNDKKKLYQRMGILLSLLNFFGIILFLFDVIQSQGLKLLFAALIFAYAFYLFYRINPKKIRIPLHNLEFIISLGWLLTPFPWVSLIFLLLSALFSYSVRDNSIHFSPSEITYISLFKKKIHWSNLSNVVLKDGLLTLDFRNNQLIQQYISGQTRIDENGFNRFCLDQLARHA